MNFRRLRYWPEHSEYKCPSFRFACRQRLPPPPIPLPYTYHHEIESNNRRSFIQVYLYNIYRNLSSLANLSRCCLKNGGAIHGLTTQLQSLVPWTTHSTPEVDLDIAVIQFVQRDQHGNNRQSHWGLVVAGNNYPVVSFSHVTTKGDGKWKLEVHQKWDISSSRSYRGGVLVGKVPQKDLKELSKIWQMKPSPTPFTENGYCRTWVLQILRKFKEKGWIFSDAPVGGDNEHYLFRSMNDAAVEATRSINERQVPRLVKYVSRSSNTRQNVASGTTSRIAMTK
ncbi:hypothetical protein C8Q75DRAFT_535981 [Abortiporus biennis]|nr:hypothetical protein C8Q75DRAFT_535981 [Abortiporus biennis]